MKAFFLQIQAVLKWTLIICLASIVLFAVAYIVPPLLSRERAADFLYNIGLSGLSEIVRPPYVVEPDQNYVFVHEDHKIIIDKIKNCLGVKAFDDLPIEMRREMIIPVYDNWIPNENAPKTAKRDLLAEEHLLLHLSKQISFRRLTLAKKVAESYGFWEVTTFITITLGMLTTILVSLSSTEFGRGDGTRQSVVRFLAVLFPALGTAAAAGVGFFAPQAEWSQASRSLASLTQLHDQMALNIWTIACADGTQSGAVSPLQTEIDNWTKRYLDVQSLSSPATGGQSGGAEGKEGGPGKKPN